MTQNNFKRMKQATWKRFCLRTSSMLAGVATSCLCCRRVERAWFAFRASSSALRGISPQSSSPSVSPSSAALFDFSSSSESKLVVSASTSNWPCKHTGCKHTGCKHTGWNNTGCKHTGWNHTGWNHTGCKHTWCKHTGWNHIWWKHTGCKHRVQTHRVKPHRVQTHRVQTHRVKPHRVQTHRVQTHRVKPDRVKTHSVQTHRVQTHRVKPHSVKLDGLNVLLMYIFSNTLDTFSPLSYY